MSARATLPSRGRLARAAYDAIRCVGIVRAGIYPSGGWRVVVAYVRLRIAAAILRGSAHNTGRVTHVAGWRVNFWSYRGLAYLFASKFIELEYWFRTEAPRPFIVDCGANIGIAILYFKTLYPDAEIIAFEPQPGAFGALAKNVQENHLTAVEIHHAAVGAVDGTAPLYAGPAGSGSGRPADPGSGQASLLAEGRTSSEVVEVVRVSRYIDRPVDLLKIDIEGTEMDVMRELAESGKLSLVREMVIEYHHHSVRNEDKLSELLRLLEDHDFGYIVALPGEPAYTRGAYQDILVRAYSKRAVGS
jgi:FkbM family methyltransferase